MRKISLLLISLVGLLVLVGCGSSETAADPAADKAAAANADNSTRPAPADVGATGSGEK